MATGAAPDRHPGAGAGDLMAAILKATADPLHRRCVLGPDNAPLELVWAHDALAHVQNETGTGKPPGTTIRAGAYDGVQMTESEIANALLTGEPEAFERFVELYRTKVFQYSYSMCGQREDAEEVAQETLFSVFQHLHQIREPERLKAWVFRIAKNACMMKRRKSTFAPTVEDPLEGIDAADAGPLPDSAVLNTEKKHLLCGAIVSLPDIYRAVVMLRDIEELSTEETADVLGVSEDVVKTRLRRAHLALRASLERNLPVEWHPEAPSPLDATCRRRLMDAYRDTTSSRQPDGGSLRQPDGGSLRQPGAPREPR